MPGTDKPREASTQQDAGSPKQPWRTEGLPKGQPVKRRPGWIVTLLWFFGYVVFFVLITLQDRRGGPQTIPYTEFKAQVSNNNIGEIFARGDTIEGALKKAVPSPGQPKSTGQQARTYQKFTTERPTFAMAWERRQRSRMHTTHGTQKRVLMCHTSIPCSTASIPDLDAGTPAPDGAESSFPPSFE